MNITPITSYKEPGTPSSTVIAYAVQCDKCYKWRTLATEEHFEEIRRNLTGDPFVCDKLPGITCENPADINYDSSQVWAIDKPDIPKTPKGFKRIATLRGDYTKTDVKYLTPDGKHIRTSPQMVEYLKRQPAYSDLSLSDFCFTAPKIMSDTVPKHYKNLASSTKKKPKLK
uniref:methyl-CpG-binding domain-containing protein 4-like n=1 Tax=Erigeron canadensis TaxID=72917 RepID=UPI001CB9A540|nr:methyl-CpG-binding domain-containing protein 4-like [Erigeron canadensis]